MPKFFSQKRENNNIIIKGSDVKHLKNVLRKNIGDNINVCDTNSSENFLCEIIEIKNEEIVCKILEKIESDSESNIDLTIFQGLPKSEKMELIIQKSVELGVNTIIPTRLKRCVVKIEGKDEKKKIDRWQKISEVAAKQSGRDYIPDIMNITDINEIISKIENYDVILVPYENENNNSFKSEIENLKKLKKTNLRIGIVIGPEGGFDENEIKVLEKARAKIVTLGKRILRTETVALAMTSVIMYELGDLN